MAVPSPFLYAGATAVCWGLDSFINKATLDRYGVDPWFVFAVKFSIYALVAIFAIPYAVRKLPEIPPPNRAPVIFATIAGSAALALGEALILMAYKDTKTPTVVTMIAYCSPLVAAVLFAVVLKEPITLRIAAGIAVTIAGLWLMANDG